MSTKQYLYKMSILNRHNSHPLEAASYYSGEKQIDSHNGGKDYLSNSYENVIWNYLGIPNKDEDGIKYENLPQFLKFRNMKKDIISNARTILWKSVYTRETRDDAQFARLFELLIPGYLEENKAKEMIMDFAKILIKEGMIVDCSLHSRNTNSNKTLLGVAKNKNNEKTEYSVDYMGFLMCTLRDYEDGLFVNKNRSWNDRGTMAKWRKEWVNILANAVNESDTENKKIWEEKLTIYSEYEDIKKSIKSKKINI